ncbi:MAG: response regulator [bacterium]|nr:response regulator [bacterium]
MNDKERIRRLEEQVEYLNKEKHAVLDAIELAAELSNFQTSLNKLDSPGVILRQTADRVRQILDFKTISFYLVSEEDSDFRQTFTDPESGAVHIEDEVNALIDDKTFAWALRRNKPVTVSAINKEEKIILHSMNTSSRIRGIFVGTLRDNKEDILDLSLFLFSMTVIACSNGLESFELYKRIKDKNKELEEHIVKLLEEEGKYRALFEQSTNSIILYNPHTRLPVDFNRLAHKNLGYGRNEFKKLRMEDYSLSPMEEINVKIGITVAKGRHTFETQHQRKDGETRNIIVNARCINLGGKTYLLTLLNDITAQKRAEADRIRLEKQLRQAQKMESLGTLAGGIAHDFNNILGVILGYGELSLMELPEDPGNSVRENTRGLLKAVARAKELVNQILTFSRMGGEKRKPTNVNTYAAETLNLLRSTLPANIEIRQHIEDTPNIILGTPTQVHQVIMNLCTNALHAMQESQGLLEIDIRTINMEGETEIANTAAFKKMKPGNYVQITVSDTGHGIAPILLERVFDPYFTTKEPGEGTGLGLSVVHGIVKNSHGNISIHSRPGKETVVKVWFPTADFFEEQEEEKLDIVLFGKEKILLVDDEEELLTSHHRILEQLKYTVVSCKKSTDALDIFLKNPADFDLIITDMTMPEMTGVHLAREVLKTRRDLPIILCTGFSELVDAKKAKAIGIREFLMKPVDKHALATAIRSVLDKNKSISDRLPGKDSQ